MVASKPVVARGGLLLATAALIAACGGGSTGSPAATATSGPATSRSASAAGPSGPSAAGQAAVAKAAQACGLLASSDIGPVLGGSAGDGSPTDAPDGSESLCGWTLTKTAGTGYGVQLDVHSGRTPADWAAQRSIAAGAASSVTGLGDDAFSETAQHGGVVYDDLWVRKGAVNFRLEVLADLGSAPLVTLARVVLARL